MTPDDDFMSETSDQHPDAIVHRRAERMQQLQAKVDLAESMGVEYDQLRPTLRKLQQQERGEQSAVKRAQQQAADRADALEKECADLRRRLQSHVGWLASATSAKTSLYDQVGRLQDELNAAKATIELLHKSQKRRRARTSKRKAKKR